MRISPYAKLIIAAVGAAATALNVAVNDNQLTSTEIITVVLAALTALGVYVVPNRKPESPVSRDGQHDTNERHSEQPQTENPSSES